MMRSGTVITGVVALAVGAGLIWGAAMLPSSRTADIGAGALPIAIGALVMVISLLVVWEGATGNGEKGEPADRLSLTLIPAMVAYVVLVPFIGYLTATAIFIAIGVCAYSTRRRLFRAALTVSLYGAITYLIFYVLLDIPIP